MGNSAGGVVSMNRVPVGAPGAQHVLAVAGGESLPTGGIRTAFHTATAAAPSIHGGHYQPSKKAKVATHSGISFPHPGGLTSRLGVPMPLLQGQNVSQGAVAQLRANHAAAGMSLPVGVGIRLGGAGGVAPSTAQNAARSGGQGFLWGGPQVAGMSDHAVAERRQRNREHAKRSRVRKKFMLESLQEQVSSLQLENQKLRTLVQDNIPEHAQKIISECCSKNTLFGDQARAVAEEKRAAALVKSDFQLMESLTSGQQNFVLSDPRLPDNPIVFATGGFYKLTGYTQEQVLGRNCRFLQGPGTNPKTVDIIRKAIATGSDCTVCILNYKADGVPFWNQFFVAALRDSDNCIVNYVSVSGVEFFQPL
jgi:PAS domain-containing protein